MSPQIRAFLALSNDICVLATSSIHSCQLAGRSAIMQGWRQLCVCVRTCSALKSNASSRIFHFPLSLKSPREEVMRLGFEFISSSLGEVWRAVWVTCVSTWKESRSRSPIFFWLCYRGCGGGARSVLEVNNSAENHGLSRCLLGKRFTHSNRDQTRPSQRKEQAHWVLHHGLQGEKKWILVS